MAKLLKDAQEEAARFRALESTYLNDLPKNLDDVRARELSATMFALNKQWKVFEEVSIPTIFKKYPEVLEFHTKLVASGKVSTKAFWQRYKYWCDEKRWIKELQRRKEEQVLQKYDKEETKNIKTASSARNDQAASAQKESGTPAVAITEKLPLQAEDKESGTQIRQTEVAAPTNLPISGRLHPRDNTTPKASPLVSLSRKTMANEKGPMDQSTKNISADRIDQPRLLAWD